MTRSRRTAREAGTKWETAVVRYLVESGWPYAERRAKTGANDMGDITGIAGGPVMECKNVNRLDLAGFLDEATVEAERAGGPFGVAWIKRKGKTSPAEGYVVMSGKTFVSILKELGY